MKLGGLSRQIVLSMMAIAFGVTLLVVITSYIFYYFLAKYSPELMEQNTMVPSAPEWVWILTTTAVGLAVAVLVAINLSRRILTPLNSVTESIRRIALGDLTARASAGDRHVGEASMLADDFNALADQLQRVTEEQAFWNAAIAHELRTPVTILRGRLQGLADGVFAPDQKQFGSLLFQVENLVRLIEDLRVVSLAASGHLSLQLRSTTLEAEVTTVLSLYEDTLRAGGQIPVLDLESEPVPCDPVRIRQALLALLENAHRHAVAGQIRIASRVVDNFCYLSVEERRARHRPGIPALCVQGLPPRQDRWRRGQQRPGTGRGRGDCPGARRRSVLLPDAGGRHQVPDALAAATRGRGGDRVMLPLARLHAGGRGMGARIGAMPV
ncbi:MAG: Signal transduction histidine-protein kinase BaeS [Herbaspirillum frisingense]|uniref:histidine kinase n=1 Tax=Herbaspirillum frisingense TaxID=92645 RepID=A0A7V8FSX8_9BURK|nr:MAG: Signal transduction histidine-protein kinase BaeS [Herbaspirillum frisingense]